MMNFEKTPKSVKDRRKAGLKTMMDGLKLAYR